ncbi:hypothetical protein AwDysgo_06240 [Bacteroidales bacterium]|nr:hypothetical protein AwDysgo_06240 [Bacteroidales bacterium]
MFVRQRRKKNTDILKINSSSAADIAFLLLIFFILTSSLAPEKGLFKRYTENNTDSSNANKQDIKRRNIMQLQIDKNNHVFWNDTPIAIERLRMAAVEFIGNPEDDSSLPEKIKEENTFLGEVTYTKKHVIYLAVSDSSNYATYLKVLNELTAAYREQRNTYSETVLGSSFLSLDKERQGEIKKIFAHKIVEKEEPKQLLSDIERIKMP